jgi:CRP-like cAMP-binding protein
MNGCDSMSNTAAQCNGPVLLSRDQYSLAVGEKNGEGRIQLRLKISQGDLAAMAGVARENVSRTMSEWRKREIVMRSSNYYCINDPKALAQEMEADNSCS